jgi:hypothetical protein
MTAKNRTDIQSEIDSLLADNTTADISAEDLRTTLETAKDSSLNLLETSNQTVASKVNGATISAETVRMGVIDYNDLATATTPISVTGGAGFVDLTNDGLGSSTNKTYKVTGVGELWGTGTDLFDWSDLSLGDQVNIRVDLNITTTAANQVVTIQLLLGVGGSSYALVFGEEQYKTAGEHPFLRFSSVYMGNTNTLNNGAKFQVSSPDNCDIEVVGWSLQHFLRG